MMAQNTKGKNYATTAQSSADITRQSIVFAITQEITNHITNELIIPSRNKSIKPKCVRPLVFRKEKNLFQRDTLYLCTTNRTKHNKAPRAPTSPFEKAFNTIILYELTY